MKAVIQRTKNASVEISDKVVSNINNGLLIYLGISIEDNKEDAEWLANRIYKINFFDDTNKPLSLSLESTNNQVLIISQFTLFASSKKGKSLSFTKAEKPKRANELYEEFISSMSNLIDENRIKSGVFGKFMNVKSNNNGPMTVIIDSRNKL